MLRYFVANGKILNNVTDFNYDENYLKTTKLAGNISSSLWGNYRIWFFEIL